MGFVVDTFAVIPQQDEEGRYPLAPDEFFARELAYSSALRKPLRDYGARAFDGIAYNPVVTRITGITLFQGFIAPDLAAQMSACLDAADNALWGGFPLPERRDLRRWFRICQQQQYGVYSALRFRNE